MKISACGAAQLSSSCAVGHLDQWLVEARALLLAHGLPQPATPCRALLSLAVSRARLGLRGLDFVERREASLPDSDLARIDICWSLANGLGGSIWCAPPTSRRATCCWRGARASRTGSRALAWQAILAATERGTGSHQKARALADRAEQLAMRIGHTHALAWVEAARAIEAWSAGLFAETARRSELALALFRQNGRDVRWEIGSMQAWWLLPALAFLGDLDQVERRAPACLNEAEELGDYYSMTTLRTYVLPQIGLAADRPSEARREASESIGRWSHDGWHVQHWCHAATQAQASMYEGQGARAHRELAACMPSIRRSQLLRIKEAWIMTLELRALAARARESALRSAERDAARLDAEKVGWASAFATLIRSGAVAARGRRARRPAGRRGRGSVRGHRHEALRGDGPAAARRADGRPAGTCAGRQCGAMAG
jgi:hypothetical protein